MTFSSRFFFGSFIGFIVSVFCISVSFAENIETEKEDEWNLDSIRLKYEYQHFEIDVDDFVYTKEIFSYEGDDSEDNKNIDETDTEFCIDENIGNKSEVLGENEINAKEEESVSKVLEKKASKKTVSYQKVIKTDAIEQYLEENIVPRINQEKSDVRIFRDGNDEIQFEGVGIQGVTLDVPESTRLIEMAIKSNVHYVSLVVEKVEPSVTVDDEKLKEMGITELVSVGRSDFNGSSAKRIINVMNGASKFQGHLIPQGEIFSFTDQLGEIEAHTGYVKELVILGNKVVPEYGGGLCQVSSTSYRAAMLSGMEIIERHNHSYAVDYYEPHGSDATIYVGVKDFQFRNTSDGALLIQTRRGGWNDKELFFHYYGTKPERDVKIFGPLKTNYRSPPATKITYDSSKAAGTSSTVSYRVTGFNSQFFRTVIEDGELLYDDSIFSRYQARGTWIIRGGAR